MAEAWDDYLPAADALAYVFPAAASDERERIARARKAGNALPEAKIVEACMRAGIPVRWDRGKVSDGGSLYSIAYIPCWAAPFYEATIAGSAQQARVLRQALRDEVYRNAGLTVWRLEGIEALVAWIEPPKLETES